MNILKPMHFNSKWMNCVEVEYILTKLLFEVRVDTGGMTAKCDKIICNCYIEVMGTCACSEAFSLLLRCLKFFTFSVLGCTVHLMRKVLLPV